MSAPNLPDVVRIQELENKVEYLLQTVIRMDREIQDLRHDLRYDPGPYGPKF